MRGHPRSRVASVARHEFVAAVLRMIEASELTAGETMTALAELQDTTIRGVVRKERHPRHPDFKGGEACERKTCPGSWAAVEAVPDA